MNSQGIMKAESLLPSSLLEEVHNSDNESDSNSSIDFNENISLFNEGQNDDSLNKVILIIIHIYTVLCFQKKFNF